MSKAASFEIHAGHSGLAGLIKGFLLVVIAPPLLGVVLLPLNAFGQSVTYSSLTANNTSAILTGAGGTPENVSKTAISSLLPSSHANTPIYAHLMVWFGSGTHENVGYSSTDPTQVQKQIADMQSRGIKGVIVNWHGASDFTDQAARVLMAQSLNASGSFEFAIEEDAQALAACAATSGCNLTSQVTNDLTYVQQTYSGATNYMTSQGRPVIFLYGMEAYTLNWTTIQSLLPGNPILVFRSANANS